MEKKKSEIPTNLSKIFGLHLFAIEISSPISLICPSFLAFTVQLRRKAWIIVS